MFKLILLGTTNGSFVAIVIALEFSFIFFIIARLISPSDKRPIILLLESTIIALLLEFLLIVFIASLIVAFLLMSIFLNSFNYFILKIII